MSQYGGLVDDPGVPDGDGETWEDAAQRIRGDRDRLLPLARDHVDVE